MTAADRAHWYGRRDGHSVVFGAAEAPASQSDAERAYLYLCVFSDILKIGVSRSPHQRIQAHQSTRRAKIDHCYLVDLSRAEALRRENAIYSSLGVRSGL